jgi:hypothetical protein
VGSVESIGPSGDGVLHLLYLHYLLWRSALSAQSTEQSTEHQHQQSQASPWGLGPCRLSVAAGPRE